MGEYQADQLIGTHPNRTPGWICAGGAEVTRCLGFLDQKPLADLSISRPKSRVQLGNHPTVRRRPARRLYVWVDALINYLTASGAIDPDDGHVGEQGFEDTCPAPGGPADLHLVGKDIHHHARRILADASDGRRPAAAP